MKIIGHRGAKGLAPENTKASFEAALAAHVDGIELDVRTTKDGALVVWHDPAIHSVLIKDSNYAEVKKSYPDILTLQEALAVIHNRCEVTIEVKKGCDPEQLLAGLQVTTLTKKVYFSSFDMSLLWLIKKEFPDCDLIVNEKWSGVRASYRCKKLATKYVAMNQRWLWFGFIHSVAKSGFKLIAYTVNNPKKARKWAKYGLYAVITDFPDHF